MEEGALPGGVDQIDIEKIVGAAVLDNQAGSVALAEMNAATSLYRPSRLNGGTIVLLPADDEPSRGAGLLADDDLSSNIEGRAVADGGGAYAELGNGEITGRGEGRPASVYQNLAEGRARHHPNNDVVRRTLRSVENAQDTVPLCAH
ncbi:hypothetical protein NN6n1_32920 [Shinella zoogloeoides]